MRRVGQLQRYVRIEFELYMHVLQIMWIKSRYIYNVFRFLVVNVIQESCALHEKDILSVFVHN